MRASGPLPSPGSRPGVGPGAAEAGSGSWQVVLPVKGGAGAKSRLGWGPAGPRLALAMALDCLDAVLSTEGVSAAVVVTADPQVARAAGVAGARVEDQPPGRPGLGGAVEVGLAAVGGRVAVLLADLPCLRPADLRSALDAVDAALASGARSAFVPDAEGVGTVLLAAARPQDVAPRFGTDSAAAHESTGAVRLALPLPGLRRDVDTPGTLAQALALGPGPRTAATLAACRPPS